MNPLFLIDFYKVGHVAQYPTGIKRVWTNWTPRYSRRPERPGAIHFGLQYFMERYLIREFSDNFFTRPFSLLRDEYKDVMRHTLGIPDAPVEHLRRLHTYGRLPINIYSVPEGTFVPCGVPSMVIVNTEPEFFWLPNYLETLLSNILWQPSTTATTASIYREIFERYAREFGETDLSFVDWMGHDFSMRGTTGIEAAMTSGMGHLLYFSGTDTVPAILCAEKYYRSPLNVGGSVPATEHSVMCAGSCEGEFETIKRLITEVYPSGIVSIVSDTWDLWKVLTDFLPRLKEIILARDGKIVIRPDSGDPVKILTGNPESTHGPERAGVLRLLADCMGTDNAGHILKAGAIYGDSITPERAEAICSKTVRELHLSPFNVVFGIGSFTYQYVTRDTYGFAMKATAIENSAGISGIFKDPVTDDGGKRSHRGIPYAVYTPNGESLTCVQSLKDEFPPECAFRVYFEDGRIAQGSDFETIRRRARNQKFPTAAVGGSL